jgi:hypothetical protein
MQAKILVNATEAAELFGVSERSFHLIRARPDFPNDAEVCLGPRMVRFRVQILERYAADLAAKTVRRSEPPQLKRGRQDRREAMPK